MNKKLIGGIIGIVTLIAVIGVGVLLLRNSNSETKNNNDGENTQMENNTISKTGSKILVAYYSASGNTKNVAEKIAANLGADIFEIVPQEIYTSEDLDWAGDSRVSREHEDESLRDIALVNTTPANWVEYDTILIGYPIWWGIAAWPVNNFVKDNDFTGKTVIPFATSASSGLGQSGELLEEMANGGDWQTCKRFSSHPSDDEIKSWASSL